ncbi:hypothetical protein GXN76_00260 [Kroppenstedtia pulmonis]|uniref:Uncharacterized protein n=1 Tax=Kroppenstedtia pulmonis TaxID=1380685 RepID=A0A7D3XPY0_9BACL|nr:hypothetical protein [Kroppenstedtia pulmonis]QKG83048.1 hypothetical protein GXN76_00260 [Kroppenstedtia pulmonis]
MVIQPYMILGEITKTWPMTKEVFTRFGVDAHTDKALERVVSGPKLRKLLHELNQVAGSTHRTCIPGG